MTRDYSTWWRKGYEVWREIMNNLSNVFPLRIENQDQKDCIAEQLYAEYMKWTR